MKENKVTIYAVGGCGINIVSPLMHAASKDEKGYANLTFGMVDTSHSNLPDAGFSSNFIHVGSRHQLTDGSGKVRGTNVDSARQAVPDILNKWEPGDLNIVIHSGSGGSGSLLSNVLVKELLSKDENVVVVMIGSRTCIKEVDNVRDTIMTYQKMAVAYDVPVPCYYLDNSEYPMRDVDARARAMLLFLSAVWSGENKGLDRKDLENFLKYNKVSQFQSGIVALELVSGGFLREESGRPISTVVSIVKSDEDASPGVMVPYHSYGELAESMTARLKIDTPVHLYTRQGVFPDVLEELEDSVKNYREADLVKTVDVPSSTEDFLVI